MNLLKACVAASLFLLAIYSAIVVFLTLPIPQRLIIFMHWVKFPFVPRFSTPEYYGFGHNQIRNIQIQTADNVTLGAWHMLPTSYYVKHGIRQQEYVDPSVYDDALSDPSCETVIYFHGNAMHRAAPWRVDLYKKLGDKFDRLNVLILDYRGFGDSGGVPSEKGLEEDAKAALHWLRSRKVERISLIGHSLGTGVATTLALEMSNQGRPPQALILKAAYSSLPTLIFEFRLLSYFPLLSPLRLVPPVQEWVVSKLTHTFDSLSRIEHIDCPILITFGASDLEIPVHNSQILFHRAVEGATGSLFSDAWLSEIQPKRIPNEAMVYQKHNVYLVQLDHADHNNIGYFDYAYEAMADVTGWHRSSSGQ
ncbi:Alpha/Beta hydrolase protein [Syncephalastrum racemosum]|uniref:Alpha/Beta hydrolase protein n=1 Tax=Syncephalastrum racemosum TaxID=13706 RepID=A0A1X2HNP5_SYNRA|nr:Alpha/Beta hydrolase protein [Syncephalastrum racemosum]